MKQQIAFDAEISHCPLCGRLKVAGMPLHTKYKMMHEDVCEFAPGSELSYIYCPCGMIYVSTYFTAAQSLDFYTSGDYRVFTHTSNDAEKAIASEAEHATPIIMELYANLDKVGSVLDIGCSSGELLAQIRLMYDCEVTGLEWNKHMAEYCKAERGIPCYADFSELGGARYDLIILSHVLEHTLEPLDLLANIKAHLSPEGSALIQVPILMPGVPHPLVFTEASAIYTLTRAGLQISDINYERHLTLWARNP
jgi:SAM-dependent methyltransferase